MDRSSLREFQDEMRNRGWRIQHIPWDDPSKPMAIKTNYPALVGALGFLTGIGVLLYGLANQREPLLLTGLGAAVASLLLMLAAVFLAGRFRRRGWVQVRAKCLDREVKQIGLKRQFGQRIL